MLETEPPHKSGTGAASYQLLPDSCAHSPDLSMGWGGGVKPQRNRLQCRMSGVTPGDEGRPPRVKRGMIISWEKSETLAFNME